MSIFTILLTALALSMDAFAVSISLSLAGYCKEKKSRITVPFFFGFFQMLMPIIGFLAASFFAKYIMAFDHYIAFLLLVFIGGKMIFEAYSQDDDSSKYKNLTLKKLITFSVATSIDALAAGISFAFLNVNILTTSLSIGIITFLLCFAGIKFGNFLGEKLKQNAEIIGGVILILIGLKIFIEHLINGI